jgi:hypothetical protein
LFLGRRRFYGFGFPLAGSGFVIFVVAFLMLRSIFMLRSIVAIANLGGGLEFLKRFDCADDGAVLVVNGNGANADGNFRSGFGMQETDGLDGLRCFQGTGDWTILVAELASGLIAMQQYFRDTATANHFVTQPATDALCAVRPKSQFFFCMSMTPRPGGRLARMLQPISPR